MPTYQVFHAKEPNFGNLSFRPDPRWPEDYNLVATVEAQNPEHVFLLTQNGYSYWPENDDAQAVPTTTGYRSTSVGDIVVGSEGTLRVDAIGWSYLSPDGKFIPTDL